MGQSKLCTFLEKNDFAVAKMHAFNWFNLALVCKLHRMHLAAISVLEKLVSFPLGDAIRKKSLLVLSELYEAIGNHQKSINVLQAYQKIDHSNQVDERIEEIRRSTKSNSKLEHDRSQPKLAMMKNTYSLRAS